MSREQRDEATRAIKRQEGGAIWTVGADENLADGFYRLCETLKANGGPEIRDNATRAAEKR